MITVVSCGEPTSVATRRTSPTDSVNFDDKNSNLEAKANAKCPPSTQLDLAPAATVGYTESIRPYLEDTCVGCHRTGGLPPDLSSFSKAKAAAVASLASINKGTMPPAPAGGASALEKATFAAWITGGTPESIPNSQSDTTQPPGSQSPSGPSSAASQPEQANICIKQTASPSQSGDADGVKVPTTNGDKKSSGPTPVPTPAPTPAPTPVPTPAKPTITYTANIKPYFDAKCAGCHGRSPALKTYANVKAAAAASLASMKRGSMPPRGGAPAKDIANLQEWINAGYPQ